MTDTPHAAAFSDAAPELYREFYELLSQRAYAIGAHIPTDEEHARLLVGLAAARVARRCGCGDAECLTYAMDSHEARNDAKPFTVRFCVNGEALLHADEDGLIYSAERLFW